MNTVQRFKKLMAFEPVDRLPIIEWAGWWTETLDRWYAEGLSWNLEAPAGIREYLGLDRYRQKWVMPIVEACPRPACYGDGMVKGREGYLRLKAEHLYPRPAEFDRAQFADWASEQRAGETVMWLTLYGYFWYPWQLLGIEPHLYAFYDDPGLIHLINHDVLEYNLWVLDQVCDVCVPTFMTFAEDMSYNWGSMISKRFFDEFIAPYYRPIIPKLKQRGIIPMIDSDGDVTELIAWFEEVGIEGILPLERMAGVDVARIRKEHPTFKMIGAFDKMVMHLGEDAMRQEFERLLPVMRQGGFIPSVDHQTPPDVSLEQYRIYASLLREYCERAAQP